MTPLVVLDTMIMVSAIIGKREASAARILRAVATGDIRMAVSDAGYKELVEVMGYEEVRSSVQDPTRAFEVALDVGTMGVFFYPREYDWPTLPDSRDEWLLDLAYESGAECIISRDRHLLDLASALLELGFIVYSPTEFLRRYGISATSIP